MLPVLYLIHASKKTKSLAQISKWKRKYLYCNCLIYDLQFHCCSNECPYSKGKSAIVKNGKKHNFFLRSKIVKYIRNRILKIYRIWNTILWRIYSSVLDSLPPALAIVIISHKKEIFNILQNLD